MRDCDRDAVLREELANIASEIDMTSVDPAADLRETLDIDSMDFLSFVTAIHERLGLAVTEIDYPKLATLGSYLAAKLP